MRRRRGGPADLLAWKEGRRWRDLRSSDINDYIHESIGSEFSANTFNSVPAATTVVVPDFSKK